MSEITAEQAVERGVAVLDAFVPGWVEMIDWEILDVRDIHDCVIGQLERKHDIWLFDTGAIGDTYSDTRAYGFDSWNFCGFSYADLTTAWKAWHASLVS